MTKHLPLILLIFLAFSCSKNNDNTTQNSVSGKFTISSLSSGLKSANSTESTDSTSFVLDTVKSSQSFYFILGNAGQEDITNITLTTDNDNFTVTPSSITRLPGTKSLSTSTLAQIVSLNVIHGTRINGVGYTKLLNMGDNYCNLTITGQTGDGTNISTVSLIAKTKVFAEVMDVAIYQGNNEFDLTNPPIQVSGLGVASMPGFYFNSSPAVFLKNTGNTTINLSLISAYPTVTTIQNSIVKPNDTLTLQLPVVVNGSSETFIKLDSQGTICDQQKIAIGPDGNGYLVFVNQDYNTQPNPPVDSTQVLKTRIAK